MRKVTVVALPNRNRRQLDETCGPRYSENMKEIGSALIALSPILVAGSIVAVRDALTNRTRGHLR